MKELDRGQLAQLREDVVEQFWRRWLFGGPDMAARFPGDDGRTLNAGEAALLWTQLMRDAATAYRATLEAGLAAAAADVLAKLTTLEELVAKAVPAIAGMTADADKLHQAAQDALDGVGHFIPDRVKALGDLNQARVDVGAAKDTLAAKAAAFYDPVAAVKAKYPKA